MSLALGGLTQAQRRWADRNAHSHKAMMTESTRFWRCTECGHSFNTSQFQAKHGMITCPCCGARLHTCGSTSADEITYFKVMTTHKGWQVNRYYLVHSVFHRNAPVSSQYTEVAQRWMKDGHLFCFECNKAPFWYNNRHPYALSTIPTLKPNVTGYTRTLTMFNMGDEEIYPWKKYSADYRYVKRLIREKDELLLHDYKMEDFTTFETIDKWGNESLINEFLHNDRERVKHHWKSILVARRHGYVDVDYNIYLDYLNDLETLHLDLHSPKYLCPVNLIEEHNRISARARAEREREIAERNRIAEEKRDRERQQEWMDNMAWSLGIVMSNDMFTIKTMQSAKDYKEEGAAMHHCVGGYAYKYGSVILSCRDKQDNRIETIEVSLSDYRIVQSRGVCNKSTEHHDAIIKLVKDQMWKIRSARDAAKSMAM